MSITISQMQGAIEQFWGSVYAKNINGVASLISTDLKASYQVTVNGKQNPVQNLDYQQYIGIVKEIFSSFNLVLNDSKTYDPSNFKISDGVATWTVSYAQTLQLTNGVMNCTGTQTWTFNGAQFVALSVIENDTINNQPAPSKCALV